MISPNDYIEQSRSSYQYSGGEMMVPGKESNWNQVLQSMSSNEHQRQQLAPQSINQGIGYQSPNSNAYISFQQMPQGITVYQPVVNTGIVVDFRQNNATPMPNSFSPGSQLPSVTTNRFDPTMGRITDVSNAYNQVLQVNHNGYASYAHPPPYSNFFHNISVNEQSMNSISPSAHILNKTPPSVANIPATNQNVTVVNNARIDQQMSAAINGQFLNHPNSLPNQSSIVSNTRIVNIQSSAFPNNMTVTKTAGSPLNTTTQANLVYRKEGALVTPTLSQLLDRDVVQSNSQSTLNQMFKPHSENVSAPKQISVPISTQNVTITSHAVTAAETNKVTLETTPKNDPPRKARLKISPRLSKEAKTKMWLSHFTREPKMEPIDEEEEHELPMASTSSLPEPDENNQWDMSKFPKCNVKLTKLPPEIEDIYFAKGNYKKCHEPLVYVVPNVDKKKVRFKNVDEVESKTIPNSAMSAEITTPDVPPKPVVDENPEGSAGSLKTVLKIRKLKKHQGYKIMDKKKEKNSKTTMKSQGYKVMGKKDDKVLKTTIKSQGYKVMEKKDDQDLKTTIKKCKIKRSSKRSERTRCNFCGKMRKPADNWRHVMAIYSKNLDENDQISKDQVKDVCPKCDTTVCSKVALTLHQQHVHGKEIEKTTGSFKCFVCKKVLKTKEFLSFHLQTHYSSPKKTRRMKRESPATENVDLSTTCEICNRKFQTGCALTAHKKVHGIYPTNTCTVCSKVFLKASHLKAHFVVHTDERPFSCTECDKTFRFRSSLKQHSHYHSDTLPYKCKICGKSFVANWSLSHHTKKVHKTNKENCSICEQSFSDRLALGSHMKLYHGKKSPPENRGKRKKSKNDDKEDSIEIEQLAESLLKQLAREEMDEGFDALTETDDLLNDLVGQPKGDESFESHEEEHECELCDAILTNVPELEKHLLYYHRVKDNKISKLLP